MDWMNNLTEDPATYWYNHVQKFPGYETIVIPKDFTVYHGGGAMKANVEYPIGRQYYDPVVNAYDPRRITQAQREILRNQTIPTDMIKTYSEEITREYIEHAYFGSYAVAKVYSQMVPGCGINCIGVYKFREKTEFVDMGDANTIYNILYYPNILDQFEKDYLAEAYGVSTNPDERSKFWRLTLSGKLEFINPIRKSLRNSADIAPEHPYRPDRPTYFIIPKLMQLFSTFGYKGFAHPISGGRISEFIIFNPIKTLVRDLKNPIDWQQEPELELFQEMGTLIKNMKLYDTTNIDFHAGDLYAHSVWVALNVQQWFQDPANKWTENLKRDSDRYRDDIFNLIVIAAFLHDIGKMGGLLIYYDKPDHPAIGSSYLEKKTPLPFKDGTFLNVDALFDQIKPPNITPEYTKCFVIGIVRLHWFFGDMLGRFARDELTLEQARDSYKDKVYEWWRQSGYPNAKWDIYFKIFITSLMIVSACDVLGSQVFVDNSIYEQFAAEIANNEKVDVNAFLLGYQYIKNAPKKHRGGNKYADFRYDDMGFKLYKAVYATLV